MIQWSVLLFIVLATWATAQSSQTSTAALMRTYRSKIIGTNDIQNDNTGNVIINSNLGIGTTAPNQRLQIDGALRLKPTGSTQQPTCSASTGGSVWYKNTAAGQKDQFEVCVKDQNNVYGWVTMGCSV